VKQGGALASQLREIHFSPDFKAFFVATRSRSDKPPRRRPRHAAGKGEKIRECGSRCRLVADRVCGCSACNGRTHAMGI
jgi:hypothetical protein